MRSPHSFRPTRRGFTLVELLVATALVVVILTVLAVAFGAATDSLRMLKATGDMAERLRTAEGKLRTDLTSRHFDGGDSPAPLRLSDLRYDLLTPGGREAATPTGGYFRIEQGSGSVFEGRDAEGNLSTRATTHAMEFTAYRRGTSPDDLFVVNVPTWAAGAGESDVPLAAGQHAFHWARVRWQLGNQTVGPDGVTTWTLYRNTRVLHPLSGTPVPATAADVVSFTPAATPTAHTLTQIANPTTRLGAPIAPFAAGAPLHGDDIVLTNVTSFEVKPAFLAANASERSRSSVYHPLVPPPGNLTGLGLPITESRTAVGPTLVLNTDYPFDDLPAVAENTTLTGQRVFDTWSGLNGWNTPAGANSLPLRIRVTAVQIKLRVHDPKTQMSRQVSFIIDL